MARIRLNDKMQAHAFWLFDVSPNALGFVINPLVGFQSITGPEITIQHTDYRPINEMYPQHFIESASVSAITLVRGSYLGVSDFYNWIESHEKGHDDTRRNLILVHFLGYTIGSRINGVEIAGLSVGSPISAVNRVPGRAWLLTECIPTRYKAGDLDATSGQVVLQELEIQPHKIRQIDLGSLIG